MTPHPLPFVVITSTALRGQLKNDSWLGFAPLNVRNGIKSGIYLSSMTFDLASFAYYFGKSTATNTTNCASFVTQIHRPTKWTK